MKNHDPSCFLTFDIGTTAIKVCLFDKTGLLKAVSTREYALHTPEENIVELPAEIYWEQIVLGTREVLETSGTDGSRILSLGACSQGESFVLVDEKGTPIRNTIVWMDNRSEAEADEIRGALGIEYKTGQTEVAATWPITKLLWLKRREPDNFSRIKKILLLEDYITSRLTDNFHQPLGSFALWTSSYMLNIKEKVWYREVLDYCGIGETQLPRLTESGKRIGCVSPKAASELGITPGTPVISGAMDQTASLIGCGALDETVLTETIGAAQAVCRTIPSFPSVPPLPMSTQYHALPDKYVLMGWCTVGGMSLKWLRSLLFDETTGYEDLTALASSVPPGAQGLLFFPFMGGPGTLPLDQTLRGSFAGLELHHGKAHLIRAVMESMGYLLRYQLEQMPAGNGGFSEIRSLGGGSKSFLWNQIRADITGKPILTMKSPEAASLGMAVLQSTAMDVYPDLHTASENMTKVKQKVIPSSDPVAAKAYDRAYEKFKTSLTRRK